MDINEVILAAADALAEFTREFIRRAREEYKKDKKSQLTACFLLAIRSASLLFASTTQGTAHKGEDWNGGYSPEQEASPRPRECSVWLHGSEYSESRPLVPS
jgi:hypothetical protein